MKKTSEQRKEPPRKTLGLGDTSIHKVHYPSLPKRLDELERFRSLVDLSSDLLFVVGNPSGSILDVSASVLDHLSTDRASLQSVSFADMVPSATWQQMLALFDELGNRPKRSAFINAELSNVQSGCKIPVEIAIQVLRTGESDYAILAARDITERRKSEQALRENQQTLRAIVYGSPIPQFVLGEDHAIISWNGALEKYTGISAESVIGTNQHWRAFYPTQRPCLADLIIDQDMESISRWYPDKYSKSDLVEGACEATDFFPEMGGSGKWLHFTAAAIKDPKGKIIGAVETLEDITERKLAEQQLRLAAAALDAAANAIVLTDRHGNILFVNPAFTRLTGYTSEEVLGATHGLLKSGANSALLYRDLWDTILSGRVWHGELTNQRKNGSLYLQDTTIAPIRSSNGEISHFVGIQVDISDRKRAEQALIQSEKLASVGRMAATIAHEINNPLSATMNAVFLANSDPGLSERTRDILSIAERELKRVAHISKQTLGFYKESGQSVIVQLPELLDGVLDLYEPKARKKSIHIQRRYGCEVPVQAVDGELRQMISNLVTNGIDALPEQGILHVRTAGPFPVADSRPMVRLTIADNGTGIRQKDLEQIFVPFFTTKAAIGTGLGLWIVSELVRKNGGRIQVRSQEGRGAVFAIWLPTERRAHARSKIA
jgi:PAS domain S-box-containing protein